MSTDQNETPTPEPMGSEKPAAPARRPPVKVQQETTFLGYIREWGDALVIAFVVAMFIRTFVVELFKIPSGSMSPTLLGDWIAEGTATDKEGDAHQYLLISDPAGAIQVFAKKDDGYYDYQGKHWRASLTSSQQVLLNKLKREEHRILVNKFAYWFSPPRRGDVAIFRVPFKLDPQVYSRNGFDFRPQPYDRNQSVYVKRAVALGGEQLEIRDDNHLYVNGEQVTKPEILAKTKYLNPDNTPELDITVPQDHVVMFGDNSDNSLDSRYWGPLPEQNLRGKAVLTYYPFSKMKFLNPN